RSYQCAPHHWKFSNLCRRIKRTRTAFQMRFEFAPPLIDNGHGRNRSSIAQRAESAAQHVLCQILDVVNVLAQTAAVVEPDQRLLEPVCSFTTGDAPTAAFMLVELHHPQRELDHAGRVVQDHDAAGAKKFTALAE